jgi:hypothetical protein
MKKSKPRISKKISAKQAAKISKNVGTQNTQGTGTIFLTTTIFGGGVSLIPPCSQIQIQPVYGLFLSAQLYYSDGGTYHLFAQFKGPLQYGGLGWGATPPFTQQPLLLFYHSLGHALGIMYYS